MRMLLIDPLEIVSSHSPASYSITPSKRGTYSISPRLRGDERGVIAFNISSTTPSILYSTSRFEYL